MAPKILLKAFSHIALVTAIFALIIFRGCFSSVYTELGEEFYAERNPGWRIFPSNVRMPLNSLVNVCYVVLGFMWLARVYRYHSEGLIDQRMTYMFYFFNWMAVVYGPVQCLRIITQKHEFAIFDQWFSLPFFIWAVVVYIYMTARYWNPVTTALIYAGSMLSYCLALFLKIGFEIALSIHIIIAFGIMLNILINNWNRDTLTQYIGLILSCVIFVIPKLLDLHLPAVHPIFTVISGHFLSKIGDFMQIHFANSVFLSVMIHQKTLKNRKRKSKKKE